VGPNRRSVGHRRGASRHETVLARALRTFDRASRRRDGTDCPAAAAAAAERKAFSLASTSAMSRRRSVAFCAAIPRC
jgi:hypothetical protein